MSYPGSLRSAPSTMVARIIAILEKYTLRVAFSLMTGVITSHIMKKTLDPKVLYGQFSDFPAAWVACVPSPSYIDTYDYIGRLQVHATKGVLDECSKWKEFIFFAYLLMMVNFLVCLITHSESTIWHHFRSIKGCKS